MINSFSGAYIWLSNFYQCPLKYKGLLYPTLEHAYQAAKTNNKEEIQMIRKCLTPGQAKKAGRLITIRGDWDSKKIKIMKTLLKIKFKDKELKNRLLATGDEELIEGNWWGDDFWGFCFKKNQGQNILGKLLMEVREELK